MLVRDTARTVTFARDVLGLTVVYADTDLAVLRHGEHEWMAHADHTYDAHPLLPRTRVAALRGGGIELRVHDVIPMPRRPPRSPAASRCWSPRRTSRTVCARPTSSTRTATSGSRICRRSANGTFSCTEPDSGTSRARLRRPFSLLCAWAAIRSTSPIRAPRARTPRRPPAACTRRRARRRSRRSTRSPRRSSPARSTAACCRSRTRSPGSCPTRSRSSRRAQSRSWPRWPCTSRTASSGPRGRRIDTIRVVHSHPMALAQCRNALNGRYERVAASTTSEAARPSRRRRRQGRRDREPARGPSAGLTIIAEEISDHPENLTRFVSLRASRASTRRAHRVAHGAPAHHKHEPGALHSAIEPLRYHDVQMMSLHSRPIMGEPWRYQFYIDVVGHRRPRACCARSRTSRTAAPSCTSWARTPSAAGCSERGRRCPSVSTVAAWACSPSAT